MQTSYTQPERTSDFAEEAEVSKNSKRVFFYSLSRVPDENHLARPQVSLTAVEIDQCPI